MPHTDFQSEKTLRNELARGEKLIWSGKPETGIRFHVADILLIPLGFVAAAAAIGCAYNLIPALQSSVEPQEPVFIPLLLLCLAALTSLYLVFGRFWVEAKMRAMTSYGVTNQRILIVSEFLRKKVNSLDLETLEDISLKENRGGLGTIVFGQEDLFSTLFDVPSLPNRRRRPRLPKFELIEDARSVYDTIQRLREEP